VRVGNFHIAIRGPERSMKLSAKMIRECQSEDDNWSLGNSVLYELCRAHPLHATTREVVAKVWLIGRAYSAAVERGRGDAAGPGLSNDSFYTEALAPALIASSLDERLRGIASNGQINSAAVEAVLQVHGYLVAELSKLTGMHKRSFASKYLHFHCPSLFFIYDSRAVEAIRALGMRRSRVGPQHGVDAEYASFVSTLLVLTERVEDQFGTLLTPRQLDRLLLQVGSS